MRQTRKPRYRCGMPLWLTLTIIYMMTGITPAQQKPFPQKDAAAAARQFFEDNHPLQSPNQGGNGITPEAMQTRYFTGQAADNLFGWSVASAGDVNGDGYCDVIVGAYSNDAVGDAAGRAYIYLGGQNISSTAYVVLTGAAAYDFFGNSVASAGDVNGDGYSDVVVGAVGSDAGGFDAGRAYIYFGGASMNTTADVILTGAAAEDGFGHSVASAGDVNGDGYSDVIIGARYNDAGGFQAGRAYIYFGGAAMNNTEDVTFTGAAAEDHFSWSVASAGDVNGDGYGDVIIGARYNDAGGNQAGRAYIYYGGQAMNNTEDVAFTGAAAGDNFGWSVASAGDVNGDGYGDVIVGAPYNDAGGTDAGSAYIYYGGAAMNTTGDIMLIGAAPGDCFGVSVASAGDVKGDGYSDVIVGSYYNDAGGGNAGRAYIYYGGALMDNTADVLLTGAASGDWFGCSVAAAGDVNGDGYSDMIVGAVYNDAGGSDAGRAYVYTNSMTGTDLADEFYTGAAAGDYFGWSVSSAGDVNGDGYNDVIVGAKYNSFGGYDAGRAYIYFGGAALVNRADVILTGAAAGDCFGVSVASAGDVNGDGYSDVVVGAYYNDAGGTDAGRVYIFYGGASMNATADVTLTGAAAYDYFGISVASAGDANGDGYCDVIVGAYSNDAGGTDAGRAYIYFGGASMDNNADVTLTGAAAGDQFGYSVASAGDVNGDGYSDMIVGAWSSDAGGGNAGRAYVYYGGAAMNNTEDIILTGAAANDHFGISVASAGDVNADGYSDVIVGAVGNDAGGANAGRSYIYFGGAAMDNTEDIILTGAAADDYFGYSVASAGDANGDGYSDVIVSAPSNDAGGDAAGRAYIYFGGPTMNNTADLLMTGAATGDNFGNSQASAGDVNGDGYTDIIIGARYNNAGGNDAGSAYLYLSSSPPVKPHIMWVKDVAFDQGGKVMVRWTRSGYEVPSINSITSYEIQRSVPPANNGYAWQTIATINPSNVPQYQYDAATPNDSMSGNSGTYYFRITAHTSSSTVYWRSNIMSGHSVDNLAPAAVKNFGVGVSGASNRLAWKLNTEADLKDYVIFRSSTPTIDPATAPVFATATDSFYLDTAPLSTESYYFIAARDVHRNLSTPSSSPAPSAGVNLTAYLEGFYDDVLNEQRADTVRVYLRNVAAPYAVIDSSTGMLSSNGTGTFKFFGAPSGSYYLVLKHRNSIQTWSKAGGEALAKGSSLTYDFSSASSQAYANNMRLKNGRWCLFGGDVNQDDIVDYTDMSMIDNDSYNFIGGYVPTDLTGDDFVDYSDLSLADNNSYNYVAAVYPGSMKKTPASAGALRTQYLPKR